MEDVRARIDDLVRARAPDDVKETLAVGLSPLTEVSLTRADNAGWQRIYLVAPLAALVLLIAGINFTNLATARSLDRIREIGVRKTLGAHRGQLARQFLVGGPTAYLLARWWLRDVARRIALTPWPFLVGGGLALLCAMAVVSVHTIRAVRIDPATTLRDE